MFGLGMHGLSIGQLREYKKSIEKTIEWLNLSHLSPIAISFSFTTMNTISELQSQLKSVKEEIERRLDSGMIFDSCTGYLSSHIISSNKDETVDVKQRMEKCEKKVEDLREEFHHDAERLQPARELSDILKSIVNDPNKENDDSESN